MKELLMSHYLFRAVSLPFAATASKQTGSTNPNNSN
jgi:hypothetical protein